MRKNKSFPVRVSFLFLCLFTFYSNYAQLRGKVTEPGRLKGEWVPVPGVLVFWKGTNIASNTDGSGFFSIPFSDSSRKLVISSIAYKGDTILVSDTTKFISIRLKSGIDLNEVEVVYETTGTEFSYLNPIKIETMGERYLAKAACCNLSESFETNPSVDVNFSDAVSGAKQIQMLGLSGKYAQITKENMPYLRGLANTYGLSFIPGTWIQSIQLSKGAGSVINGYESFTGQINTELHSPENSERLNFNAYLNQNARNEYNLNLKHKFNDDFAMGLLNHVSFNPMPEDLNSDGFMDIPTGRQYNFMNKYSYENEKGAEFQFGGGYLQDEREGGQSHHIMKEFPHDSMYKVSLYNRKWELYSKTGYVFRKKPGTSLGLQLSYLNHEQNNRYGFTRYNGNQETFYANFIFQGILGTTAHTYRLGSSFLHDFVHEQFQHMAFERSERATGVFTEYAYNKSDKFNLVAGLRADYHNYYGLFFTPRLHMRYGFNNSKSVIRFSGGRALKTANILAENMNLMVSSRQWNLMTSNLDFPYGLNPEIGWNVGFNFMQKFNLNYREAYFTVDVYRTWFSSQVITDMETPGEVWIYNLNGKSFSNTLQAEFGWEIRKRLHIKTAYRYVESKSQFRKGLLQIPYVPIHRAFANLMYETKNKHWQFDATLQYNGERRLPSTESNPAEYRRPDRAPAFYQVLGQISYVTKLRNADFSAYLGVENALNYKQQNPIIAVNSPYSRYFDASMIWGPIYGRMLYAGIRYKLK